LRRVRLPQRWRAGEKPVIFAGMEADSPTPPKRSLTEILFVVFLRLVALVCFWFGLQYWSMLVGYSFEGRARFDLLSLPWRAVGTGLAVVYPVVSLGLWMGASWGAVLWVIAAGTQLLMYQVWPDIFGHNILVPLMHGLVASLYIVFRLALFLEERRKMEERVRVDLP
jgi:hypothetical protein